MISKFVVSNPFSLTTEQIHKQSRVKMLYMLENIKNNLHNRNSFCCNTES